MATRVRSIPPPPWESKDQDNVPPPPWETGGSGEDNSIPPPPWQSDVSRETSLGEKLAAKTSGIVKSIADKTVNAPLTIGEKITDVSARGRELKSKALEDLDLLARTPANEVGTSEGVKAGMAGLAEIALENTAMTPEDIAAMEAIGFGVGKAGKMALGALAKRYPSFFEKMVKILTKDRSLLGDELIPEKQLDLPIPDRLKPKPEPVTVEKPAVVTELEKPTISREKLDILDKEPPSKSIEKPQLNEAQKRIFYQDPQTQDVFYEGYRLSPEGFKSGAEKIAEINRIGNEIRVARDLTELNPKDISERLKNSIPDRVEAVRLDLINFVKKEMGGDADILVPEIQAAKTKDLPFISQKISNNFVKKFSDLNQPLEPGLKLDKPVPSRLPEIKGGVDKKVRGVSSSVEARAIADDFSKTLGDLPEYKVAKMDEHAAIAQDMVDKDYERAVRIAMREEAEPRGTIPEMFFLAVENKAKKDGDINTLMNLATKSGLIREGTTMGQRLRAWGEHDLNSPVGAISDIAKIRKEMAIKRFGDRELKIEGEKIARAIDTEIMQNRLKSSDWTSFIESIRC